MAKREEQLTLWRVPKFWPLQTVEALLSMVDLAVQNPQEAEIAAIVRATIQPQPSSSWSLQAGGMRPFKEPISNESQRSPDAVSDIEQMTDVASELPISQKKQA